MTGPQSGSKARGASAEGLEKCVHTCVCACACVCVCVCARVHVAILFRLLPPPINSLALRSNTTSERLTSTSSCRHIAPLEVTPHDCKSTADMTKNKEKEE